MATNSSRGNPIAAGDDAPPATDDYVPPVSTETKEDVTDTAGAVHQGGEDASAPVTEDQTVTEVMEDEDGESSKK